MASSTRNRHQREEREKKDPPVAVFASGLTEVSVWENEIDTDDGQKTAFAVSFQRSYRTEKDEWKKTTALRPTDCLVLAELLRQAWAWIIENSKKE